MSDFCSLCCFEDISKARKYHCLNFTLMFKNCLLFYNQGQQTFSGGPDFRPVNCIVSDAAPPPCSWNMNTALGSTGSDEWG